MDKFYYRKSFKVGKPTKNSLRASFGQLSGILCICGGKNWGSCGCAAVG